MTSFTQGDLVRVQNPDRFITSLASRIRDRDAVVMSSFTPLGSKRERIRVRFLKRNGRGKEFEEIFYPDHLTLVKKASA